MRVKHRHCGPEPQSILSAVDEMKSGLSNKADLDVLNRMEMQLMEQVHGLITTSVEQAAAAAAKDAPRPTAEPSDEAVTMINSVLADLGTLREELLHTQSKLSDAEQKAIDHAAETARMFFNAKQEELEAAMRGAPAPPRAATPEQPAPQAPPPQEQQIVPAGPDLDSAMEGVVRTDQLDEKLGAKADVSYCEELFRQLEEQLQQQLQQQSSESTAVVASGSTEL